MLDILGRWIWSLGRYALFSVSLLFPTALVLLYMNQRALIYPSHVPAGSRREVWTPDQFGFSSDTWKLIQLKSKDGTELQAYVISALNKGHSNMESMRSRRQEGALTVLYLHANAGNMGHRLPIAKAIYDVMDQQCHIVMLSYRGYGKSQGSPSEQGMRWDAKTALEYILQDPTMGKKVNSKNRIVVYGQSIGGAVAIDVAASHLNDIDGVILENTFLSIPKLIPTVFPILKYLTFLCTEKWTSEEKIHLLTNKPLLFLSGSKDELVPPDHMKTLHQLSKSANSSHIWKEFKDGTHNDTFMQPDYFAVIAEYLRLLIQND